MATNAKQLATTQPPIFAGSCNQVRIQAPIDATTLPKVVVTVANRVGS